MTQREAQQILDMYGSRENADAAQDVESWDEAWQWYAGDPLTEYDALHPITCAECYQPEYRVGCLGRDGLCDDCWEHIHRHKLTSDSSGAISPQS